MTDSARVDQWLWAVRIYKSRSIASDACKGGHVTVNGRSVEAGQHRCASAIASRPTPGSANGCWRSCG